MASDDPTAPKEPLSSDELLRRAREGLGTFKPGNEPTAEPEASPPPDEDISESMVDAASWDTADVDPAPPPPDEDISESMVDAASWDTADVDPAPPPPDRDISESMVDAASWEDARVDPAAMPPLEPDPFSTGDVVLDEMPASAPRPRRVTDRMSRTIPPIAGGPVGRDQPSALRRLWEVRGIVVVLVIVGVVVFSFFDRSTDVDGLLIGDCFDEPAALEFSSVDVVDCGSPHDYEVLATVSLSGTDYPGDFEVIVSAFEECEFYFESYVGTDFATSEVYIAPFVPAQESWEDGEREAICGLYLASADGVDVAKATGSFQGSGR